MGSKKKKKTKKSKVPSGKIKCPDCEKIIEEGLTFCPECGKRFLPAEKTGITKPEKVEKPKTRKGKRRFSFPKIFSKIPRKTMLILLFVVCIVIVAAASLYYYYPFSTTNGTSYGGRTFVLTINNSHTSNAECYLKVGALAYGDTFLILAGEELTIDVIEDDLHPNLLSSDYDITLFATINELTLEDTAYDVTDSASFSIFASDGQHDVNCTGSL